MKKIVFLSLLSFFGLCAFAGAEQSHYKQTRVNVKIRVLSFGDASADLRELISEFDGQIQNLNLDHNNSNGSSSLRISHNEVPAFLEKLALLGSIESQSQHTNDNSNSARSARLKIKAFKALSGANTKAMFAGMDAETKAVVLADYENWVRGRLSGSINNLKNYDEMAGRAQIDINFVKDENPTPAGTAPSPDVGKAVDTQAHLDCQAPVQGQSPLIYILCLMNFLGLWVIYRRVEAPIARLHD